MNNLGEQSREKSLLEKLPSSLSLSPLDPISTALEDNLVRGPSEDKSFFPADSCYINQTEIRISCYYKVQSSWENKNYIRPQRDTFQFKSWLYAFVFGRENRHLIKESYMFHRLCHGFHFYSPHLKMWLTWRWMICEEIWRILQEVEKTWMTSLLVYTVINGYGDDFWYKLKFLSRFISIVLNRNHCHNI